MGPLLTSLNRGVCTVVVVERGTGVEGVEGPGWDSCWGDWGIIVADSADISAISETKQEHVCEQIKQLIYLYM